MCADAIYPPNSPELAGYESMPEVSCAAVDRQQAKRVWEDARAMALASPEIMKRLNVRKNSISHKQRQGDICDDSYFIMIRAIDDGDDPHDETTWVKANPISRGWSVGGRICATYRRVRGVQWARFI